MNLEFWKGRRVFITGHTGFKGGWLSVWLSSLGAEVYGYALEPLVAPNFFEAVGLANELKESHIADIRDLSRLQSALELARPEVVFHLAAQPLVRESYVSPVETFSVNVLGTVNVLESIRGVAGVRAVVVVTSDKCYENQEWDWGYREIDPMGGHDPYSSSKGCAELVAAAYRRSFLDTVGVGVATARAGNVIGGGDWAAGRLVPDCIRALESGDILKIRFPESIRPWQHVLEPLSGYLRLGERLVLDGAAFAEGWNFGPNDGNVQTVREVLGMLSKSRPDLRWSCDGDVKLNHEARLLKLDSNKARAKLGWTSRWDLSDALHRTLEWHRAWEEGSDMKAITLNQIRDYSLASCSRS